MSHIVLKKLDDIAAAAELRGWRVAKEPDWDRHYSVGSVMVEQPVADVWVAVTVDADDAVVVEMRHGEVQYECSSETLDEAVEEAVPRIKQY